MTMMECWERLLRVTVPGNHVERRIESVIMESE
jgi:hypothetical protein